MNMLYPFCDQIKLHVRGRISAEDAARQERTAQEILRRLAGQPGVVLADGVGMGKTFVALAVAVSAALSNRGKRPVVVMVPSSLKEKWPADFELFLEKCLPEDLAEKVKYGRADHAVEFLKLLDDPPERKKSILFVTHGALSRGLTDKWVRLALIYRALLNKWGSAELRIRLSRHLGRLLGMSRIEIHGQGIWTELLSTHPSRWLAVLDKWDIDPEGDDDPETDDDPVPKAVWEALHRLDTSSVLESLRDAPKRSSKHLDRRIIHARQNITAELRSVWKECIVSLKLKLPLLILDEAHHLKNSQTRLASLFHVDEARDDAEEIARGPLGGVFERMVFLTATPFQLGHGELCSVLERFGGISWSGKMAPSCGKGQFLSQLQALRESLDAAQQAAVTFDTAWGLLRQEDLAVGGKMYSSVDEWWEAAQGSSEVPPAAAQALDCYRRTHEKMRAAESKLSPWVIRHHKPRSLPQPYEAVDRRRRYVGGAICSEDLTEADDGIPVTGQALLPFLLAARATSHAPDSRPVFAGGLASSYEAFLHTSLARRQAGSAEADTTTDTDDDQSGLPAISDASRWYLDQLEAIIPKEDNRATASHPKVAATVQRATDLWAAGEKVVVFCHYIATGKALRRAISARIDQHIRYLGSEKLGCANSNVTSELDRIGRRFFVQGSPLRRACDAEVLRILQGFPALREHYGDLVEVVRRNVRTPSFLVRFFPLERSDQAADAMAEAMDVPDQSELTLRKLLEHFFRFLAERCSAKDRGRYINAVEGIQTGIRYGSEGTHAYEADELQGDRPERLIPNVRLVNGATKSGTRQRLMLTFNTPFYPDVLIASSVMAEGVDLHLNCRYVIHHDLCWNPSMLEQRTGRIDRIGAKVEHCGHPIHVYLPYVAETQDEKMYRVVMDRERWFSVVMGEEYKVDARTTEKMSKRMALPESAAEELAFSLDLPQRRAL